jgi:MYXO-CTERM domain-containing protein
MTNPGSRQTYFVWAALWLALGCRSDEPVSGTSVGNPGQLALSIAEGTDATIAYSWASVGSVEMLDCEGNITEVVIDEELAFNGMDAIEIPWGRYCGCDLILNEPLAIEGTVFPDEEGFDFLLFLPIEDRIRLRSDGPFDIDEDAFILEIGEPGWITPETVPIDEPDVEIEPDDEIALWLADDAESMSALYYDDNADGIISDEEREWGPTAYVPDLEEEDEEADEGEPSAKDEDGCGCATGANRGISWAWMGLIGLGVGLRRRYQPPVPAIRKSSQRVSDDQEACL